MRNSLGSERAGVVGVIDPDNYVAAAYSTAWVSMAALGRIMALLSVGDMAAGATVDAKLEQRAGTGAAKDVTGKAIATLTQTPTDKSNTQCVIDCKDDELDVANGYDQVRLTVTVANAAVDLGAVVAGMDPRYWPASGSNLASVDQIVS